jgi:hypothetical protein
MQNTEKNTPEITIEEAINPLVQLRINFRDQRMLLHEMFAHTVASAPDNETDNFTAKKLTPFYLALCEVLENIDSIDEIHSYNIVNCMSKNLNS